MDPKNNENKDLDSIPIWLNIDLNFVKKKGEGIKEDVKIYDLQ